MPLRMRRRLGIHGCVTLCVFLLARISAGQEMRPLKLASELTREVGHGDAPRAQAGWFLDGRRYPPISPRLRELAASESAAAKLREAFAENDRVRTLRFGVTEPSWTELGPRPQVGSSWGNVSGRVTSLALDPSDKTGNTLYVGTAFGGLWKCVNSSTSLSQSCNPSGDFDSQVTLSIGSIAVSAERGSTVVYVGTGEANGSADSYYGQGILRSPDGGKSWDKPVFVDKKGHDFSGAAVSKIVVSPDNPQMVFAAVTTASLADGRKVSLGIYGSQDGGKSWSLELGDSGASDLIYESTRRTYYAAVVGKGIYKRSANDDKWILVKSPFQCTSAITDTNFSRASLASRGGVLWALISDNRGQASEPSGDDFGLVESRDGGDHWSPVRLPDGLFGGQGYYNQYVEAPPNSAQLVVGGIDVWTTNYIHGTNTEWTNLTNAYYDHVVHPDQHAIAFIDSQHWYIGNDGGLWTTANAGGNWTNLNSTIGAIQFVGVTPDPNVPGIYLGGSQDNDVSYRMPAGSSQWVTTLSGDGGYTAVDDKHHYFAENNNVSLFYSDSSSGQWKPVVDGRTINEREAFYVPYGIITESKTQVALGTFRVWIGPATPECAGSGWRPVSDDLTRGQGYVTAVTVVPNSHKILVVTSDSMVQGTDDILSTHPIWTDIGDANLPTGRAYSSVAVSPADADIVYLGVMGFGLGYGGSGTGHVFKRLKTPDGFRWINISGNLKDVPVNSILVDPATPSDIYVGTDAGVWLTTDGGKEGSSWIPYGEKLPRSAVLQLKMSTHETGTRLLVAATHGRGAWVISPQH
jgi:hypothetical protein